jgi:hypothetical protein
MSESVIRPGPVSEICRCGDILLAFAAMQKTGTAVSATLGRVLKCSARKNSPVTPGVGPK